MELELENLDINDDPLELECGDEAEDLAKKLLDEQGKITWRHIVYFEFIANLILDRMHNL